MISKMMMISPPHRGRGSRGGTGPGPDTRTRTIAPALPPCAPDGEIDGTVTPTPIDLTPHPFSSRRGVLALPGVAAVTTATTATTATTMLWGSGMGLFGFPDEALAAGIRAASVANDDLVDLAAAVGEMGPVGGRIGCRDYAAFQEVVKI